MITICYCYVQVENNKTDSGNEFQNDIWKNTSVNFIINFQYLDMITYL